MCFFRRHRLLRTYIPQCFAVRSDACFVLSSYHQGHKTGRTTTNGKRKSLAFSLPEERTTLLLTEGKKKEERKENNERRPWKTAVTLLVVGTSNTRPVKRESAIPKEYFCIWEMFGRVSLLYKEDFLFCSNNFFCPFMPVFFCCLSAAWSSFQGNNRTILMQEGKGRWQIIAGCCCCCCRNISSIFFSKKNIICLPKNVDAVQYTYPWNIHVILQITSFCSLYLVLQKRAAKPTINNADKLQFVSQCSMPSWALPNIF